MSALLPFDSSIGPVTVTQTDHVSVGGVIYPAQLYYSIDFGVPVGTQVLSIEDGVVVSVVNNVPDGTTMAPIDSGLDAVAYPQLGPGGTGNQVTIYYASLGMYVTYAHLEESSVPFAEGQSVSQGDLIGVTGLTGTGTGPHLHITYGTTLTGWGGSTSNVYPTTQIANGSTATNPVGFELLFAEAGDQTLATGQYVSSNNLDGGLQETNSALELSNIDGTNGFQMNGEASTDNFGFSVASAGDVNGDGFDDLIIGAGRADTNGYDSGASYVVFGKAGGFRATLEVSTLNGTNGFQINGEAAYANAGRSVASAGDINGDGFDDLIIGARGANPNGYNSGTTYVVFGRAGGFGATLELSTLNGTTGFQINGEAADDFSGSTVASAGDINGDGFDDLIIGAYGHDANGRDSGAVYVVFGKAGGFGATLELSTLNGATGFQINGEAGGDRLGHPVASAGDVNGDGFDDLIIGASGARPNGRDSGASYVVFGKADGFGATLEVSTLNGTTGFQINGEAESNFFGYSVAAAGDINGDGFGDLIIGAIWLSQNDSESGSSYVVFGKAGGFGATLELSTLNGTTGFQINGEAGGDRSGQSVASAGDVNGDGFDDLVIGANLADPNGSESGASYVVFGKAGGFGATLELSSLNSTTGFQINGEAAGDRLGGSVASAGDINGDGFDDLIIGAYTADPNGDLSGASYVLFGSATIGRIPDNPENRSPEWQSANSDDTLLSAYNRPGVAINIALGDYFTDPDGDEMTFTVSGLPAGLLFNAATGRITGSFTTAAGAGVTSITASDPDGGSLTVSLNYGQGGPVGPGPDLGALALDIEGDWALRAGSQTVYEAVAPGTIWLGHAAGNDQLLRIEGGTIRSDGQVAIFTGAEVYAGSGSMREPLFTGNFTIDLDTLRTTAFAETAPRYAAGADFDFADLVEFRFGSMSITQQRASFGVDVNLDAIPGFPNVWTTGRPLSLDVGPSGIWPALGTIGTGTWFNKPLDFPIFDRDGGKDTLGIAFSKLGMSWDGTADALYLMGTATFSATAFGYDRSFVIDVAGKTEPDRGIFTPGDKFVRYSAADGWDIVGTMSYSYKLSDGRSDHLIKSWGIQSLELDVNTITNRVEGSISLDMPILNGFRVTGEVTAFWDPFEVDGFRVALDGLRIPTFWGLFVTGGHIEVSGLADANLRRAEQTEVEVGVDFSLLNPQRSLMQGTLSGAVIMDAADGERMIDGLNLGLEAEAKLSFFLTAEQRKLVREGEDSGFGIVDRFANWFGLDGYKLLNYEFMSFDGTWDYDWIKGRGTAGVDMELFGGLLSGEVEFELTNSGDWTLFADITGRVPEGVPYIGGIAVGSGGFYFDVTIDGTWETDYAMVWLDVELFRALSITRGVKVSFDGDWSLIGADEVELIGSWALDDAMPWAIMTARWDIADRGARLIVITPDGERLTERDLARRDDIAIVTDLSSPFSRSVAVRTPSDGIWDIEVVSGQRLGQVVYSATTEAEEARASIDDIRFVMGGQKMRVDISATAATDASLRLFLDTDREGNNGIEITDRALGLVDGAQKVTLDISEIRPGDYWIYSLVTTDTSVPLFAYADDNSAIAINLYRGGRRAEVLTGSGRDEAFFARAGRDVIIAGGGADTIDGGDGVDRLTYESVAAPLRIDLLAGTATLRGDVSKLFGIEDVTGGRGADHIFGTNGANDFVGGAGRDRLSGLGGTDVLDGGRGNDRLSGGAGRDALAGGAGSDILTGGDGQDRFVFDGPLGIRNADRITDLNVAADTIRLEGAIFTRIGNGNVSRAEFHASQSGNAVDASDRILYETDTGKIFFDVDGKGGAAKVLFAIVDPGLALTSSDFLVF